ncbi:hypothetical protein [Jejuia pallidilutea]|nr:hypothetical protein [Jejuia pallidilutea]
MNNNWINIMVETNRVKLTKEQYFWHYAIIPFFVFITLLNLYSVFQIEITHTYTGVRSTKEHLLVGLPWLIPAAVFGYIQYRRLRFKKFKVILTSEEFKKAVEDAGNEMNWNFIRFNSKYVIAKTKFNWYS